MICRLRLTVSATTTHVSGSDNTILKIEQVSKRYGKMYALDGVSFEVGRGSHVLLLGPNGAGKTTLIRAIMDLIGFKGKITVNGLNVHSQSRQTKSMIGYVPQIYSFYETISVYDHSDMSAKLKRVKKAEIEEKLKLVDLWEARRKRVKDLSSGMRQRLGIALALLGDPQLLLLDEPTANVDHKGQLDFEKLLTQLINEGKTLVTTTHLPGLSSFASDVKVINKGKIIASGSPDDLLNKMGVLNTISVRFDDSDRLKANEIMKNQKGVSEVQIKGEWLEFSVGSADKMSAIEALEKAGLVIDDIIIERSTIDAEYLNLLEMQEDS
jgi:ABC-2 type transport system ATP-binding protein